ncbi:MAG TPA: Lpg1974 family pore-forming outer membrane protein [Rhizomicrobium sp.]
MTGAVYGAGEVRAADDESDHPTLWVELGGQLNRLAEGQETFSPPLLDVRPPEFSPSQKFERLPLYSIDESGKVSFQPEGSDWVVSASVLYGRSASQSHVHQQITPSDFTKYFSGHHYDDVPSGARFADTTVRNKQNHLVVDFQAGKDVGLGIFGDRNGSSVFSLGVRYAQFGTQSTITLKSNPDWHFYIFHYGTLSIPIINGGIFHSNAAQLQAERSFHGVGPSLSWKASTPFAGSVDSGEIVLDWGINAAVLFGRQKAKTHHQSTGRYAHAKYRYSLHITSQPPSAHSTRSRAIVAPNVDGFAGLSFRIQNFKVSAGYRADLFFGAMDGGIDAAKKENVGFYGPFAAISVGLGG